MNADVQTETDVRESVDRLVGEIDRAVTMIEQLRGENADLKERARQLEARLEQQAGELTDVRGERDRLQRLYDENSALIENKGEIQSKIESMLSRLDAVQSG